MAYQMPDGLIVPLIVMAAIILALLWRDKISTGSSGGGDGGGGGTTERDPRVNARHRGGDLIGDPVKIFGTYDLGSASSVRNLEIELNNDSIGVDNVGGGSFTSEEVEVTQEQNEYTVKITTSDGSNTDTGRFAARREEPPGEEQPPRVRVTQQNVDHENRRVALKAEAESRDEEASIQATGFVKMLHQESGRGFEYEQNPQNSPYLNQGKEFLYEDDDMAPGTYHYVAWTIDTNENTDVYTDSFHIEPPEPGPGGERRRGTGIGVGGGAGGTPIIYNPQVLERRAGGEVPDEVLKSIEQIAQAILDSTDDQKVEVELGQELESLVAVLERVGDSLSGDELENIVSTLQEISAKVENDSVDPDSFENKIDQIIQVIRQESGPSDREIEIMQRLEAKLEELNSSSGGNVSGIEDFEKLVENVGNPEVNVENTGDRELYALMSQMMQKIETSSNPENEMDKIVEAIREQGEMNRELMRELMRGNMGDRQKGAVSPSAMTKDPESGGEGNKNKEGEGKDMAEDIQEVEQRMDHDIKQELDELEEEYKELEKLVELQGNISEAEELLQQDVEEVVKHLKKARQYEHHLTDYLAGKKTAQQTAEQLEHSVEDIRSQINQAQRAIREFKEDFDNLRKRVQNQRQLVKQTDEVEGKIETQEENLENLEEVLERTVKGLEDSGLNHDEYN